MSLDYASIDVSRWRNLPPPPGWLSVSSAKAVSSKAVTEKAKAYEALKERRAWDFAISPAKQLPMQFFMLYMSGGGVQIFSMGIVAMLLFSPFKALAGINSAFAPFAPGTLGASSPHANDTTTLALQKIVYLGCNVLTLLLGLWKCRQMGLLPTGSGDWLAFETRGLAPELSLL